MKMTKRFIILAFFCLILTINGAIAINDTGLQAYWSFDDGTLTDLTGNGFNGTNAGTLNTTGIIGSARDFDGALDFFDVRDARMIDWMNDFDIANRSWCMWINGDNHQQTTYVNAVLDADTQPKVEMLLTYYPASTETIRMTILDDSSGFINPAPPHNFNNGEWGFVCGVWEVGSTDYLKVYLNGTQAVNSSGNIGTISQFTTDDNLTFGARRLGSTTDNEWNGQLDEISLWNRSLSDSEILELFNNGTGKQYPFSPPPEPPTVNLTITAVSNWSSNNITNFSALINSTF